MRAEWLFLLTDVAHLYTANPGTDPTAQPILEVDDMADLQARKFSAGVCVSGSYNSAR